MTPTRWHVLALTALLVTGVLRYHAELFSAVPLADEQAYVCAARAVRDQLEVSTCTRYLYGPVLAHAGAFLLQFGESALLGALRACVLSGAIATIWLSLLLTGFGQRARLGVAALALLAWPPLVQAVTVGNLSSAVAALTLAAMLLLERRALVAGWLLGLAIVIKPLPIAVPVVLLAGAIGVFARERRVWVGPLLSALCALLLVGLVALLGQYPAHMPSFAATATNQITVVRVLHALGHDPDPLHVFVAVVLLGATLGAARHWQFFSLATLGIVTSLLAFPLVWNHSWLLATPLIALAFERAVRRYRTAPAGGPERPRAMLTLVLVSFGVVVLSISDELGALAQGSSFEALIIAVPLLTPAALLASLRG